MINRRHWLQMVTAAAGASALNTLAHNSAGWVKPPLPVPDLRVTLPDGKQLALRDVLRGRVTALQLMFTGCTSTCPLQGALFAQVQARVDAVGVPLANTQLVSLSIDPLGDSLSAMAGWLRQFGANPRWRAVVPQVKDLDTLLNFVDGRSKGLDRHTAQVFMFNARAELVLRSVDHPPAAEVVRWLSELSAGENTAKPGITAKP
jgi:protein SCO1/2